MSTQQRTRIHTTDTLTVISRTLQQPDENGTLAAVDLTGKTVTFKMLNTADDSTTIAATEATIDTPLTGQVSFDLPSGGVTAAGIYRIFFIVTDSGETDHFPVRVDDDLIYADSDSTSAEDAHAAAIAS